MIKEIKLQLGGSERTLKFGTFGLMKHIGDVYSGDPLDMIQGVSAPSKVYEMVLSVVYGGLRCAGDAVTKEQVDAWVQDLDMDEAAKILEASREAYVSNNGQTGETEARTITENA